MNVLDVKTNTKTLTIVGNVRSNLIVVDVLYANQLVNYVTWVII